MRLFPALLVSLGMLGTLGSCDFAVKRYSIDLDLEPRLRWKEIVEDHKEYLPAVAEESKKYVPKFLQLAVFWVAKQLIHFFPKSYAEELRGISEASGLPLGEIVGLNILYDITAFDRGHIFGLGCTSVVAEDSKGRIIHGRNLDYEMGSLLRNITVMVDFTRNGKVVYSGITFVLYNGLLTGQRPNAFSVTLNARYSGAYVDNILMEIYTHFRNPISYLIREVLEEEEYYFWAVERLRKTPTICPSYITVAGTKSGEGVVISRNRMGEQDMWNLNVVKGQWFLVETNFDHWNKQGDQRRKKAAHNLQKLGKRGINPTTMYHRVLSREPVLNNLTIYTTVMMASQPTLMQDYTFIREVKH